MLGPPQPFNIFCTQASFALKWLSFWPQPKQCPSQSIALLPQNPLNASCSAQHLSFAALAIIHGLDYLSFLL